MTRGTRRIALWTAATILAGSIAWVATASAATTTRRAGQDRYETAAQISAAAFSPGVEVAFVATGRNFPDALAGGAAAGSRGAPVLLADGGTLPNATRTELTRLAPASIVVLGGTDAVPQAVATALEAYAPLVLRVAGFDRYGTAAAVSAGAFSPGVPVAYLATGTTFPDALAAAAAGGSRGGPVLLTTPTALPTSTALELDRLDPGEIVILGGTAAVSAGVQAEAAEYGTTRRLAGDDRFHTAALVAEDTFGGTVPTAFLATGTNFPDALAGAAAAGSGNAPLLLAQPSCLPAPTGRELRRLDPGSLVLLGGTAALSPAVQGLQPCISAPGSPYAIQPLYVLASDGTDRGYAQDGSIERSIAAFQGWFSGQSGGSTFRVVDGPIPTVRLGQTDAQLASNGIFLRNVLEDELEAVGYTDPRRIYAVYYDGSATQSCGGAAYPPGLVGSVAAIYLRAAFGTVDCDLNPFSPDGVQTGYRDFAMLHEIVHTLGYVPACAPSHHDNGHTTDGPTDLMYSGNQPWHPSVLDIGQDDYWKADIPGCPDLSRSAFLAPLPANAEPPPGW